jgi:hypothetical protein
MTGTKTNRSGEKQRGTGEDKRERNYREGKFNGGGGGGEIGYFISI